MSLKAIAGKLFANIVVKKTQKEALSAIGLQQNCFNELVEKGKQTSFGKDHQFSQIKNYTDFKNLVPIADYEKLKPYMDRVCSGEENVVWPGKPVYLSKTSGTTSGTKYIPITKDSVQHHMTAARNALLHYVHYSGNKSFIDGKMIFLSGSPELTKTNGIHTGRLSGIVNHHIPNYLQKNKLPSYSTNCIEDWEEKLDAIVSETEKEDMRLISGIPPWVQMYFDKLSEKENKKIKDIFPNFSLFVHGGVNFEPYKEKLEQSIGKRIDSIETYPASEGFIAYQDQHPSKGLLLNANAGIFYEFIKVEDFHSENPERIMLKDVQVGVNYALIISTNAGLWAYNIGDTVEFISTNPYRLKVTGRIKHFISAFGEHVIGKEVDEAMIAAAKEFKASITEFTVAPQVNPNSGLPYHEWFIEFEETPMQLDDLASCIDKNMQEQNIYYKDLVIGNVLQPCKISAIEKNGFINYMKSKGKLGGQNKVPRLSNDRAIADELSKFAIQ
ncbi:MAG: GH3 auxin-responsive promoter family protein [Bacteroidia bacterium]|nr:GH3 auxin-responsive promoter family protein [Bacteroidia bacterium]NNM16516.1 GH3 auxin-responsive promoter family protein [Bacteroidia bacterium]